MCIRLIKHHVSYISAEMCKHAEYINVAVSTLVQEYLQEYSSKFLPSGKKKLVTYAAS